MTPSTFILIPYKPCFYSAGLDVSHKGNMSVIGQPNNVRICTIVHIYHSALGESPCKKKKKHREAKKAKREIEMERGFGTEIEPVFNLSIHQSVDCL